MHERHWISASGDGGRHQAPDLAMGTNRDVAAFLVHDLLCCLDIQHVTRVLPLAALDPVPLGPPHMRGVLSVGTCEVPVIDLAERLSLPGRRFYDLATPILLCRLGAAHLGLIVTAMLGVATARQRLPSLSAPLLGTFATEYGRAQLLDPDWLFTADRQEGK